jgi:hypothetical protein
MAARGLVRLLLVAIVVGLASAPAAVAGGPLVQVSGTGGGYIALVAGGNLGSSAGRTAATTACSTTRAAV